MRDELLERGFEQRSASAYEAAYRRFRPRLVAIALRVLGDPGAAAECVHDVFLQLWRSGGYSAVRGSLQAFLAVCVRNRALMQLRSKQRGRSALERVDRVHAYTLEDDPIERARIQRALGRLPDGQADVIELAYYRGLTLTEVATELSMPIGTVKTRLSAALRALRQLLAEHQYET